MPVSLPDLLADLTECFRAGATGVHLHVRDGSGAESLDPAVVNTVVARVRELDPAAEIGLTTGAWIVPDLAERVAMIREWEGVDCATVNLSEGGFEAVMGVMAEAGIGIDVGLWEISEMPRLLASGFLPLARRVSIEIDPGEDAASVDPADVAREINDALDEAGSVCPRLTHGSGVWTWPMVEDAFRRGHDTRVGFEDSVFLPDGTVAGGNAALVVAAVELAGRIR